MQLRLGGCLEDGLKKAAFALPEIAWAGSERVAVASDSVRDTAFF